MLVPAGDEILAPLPLDRVAHGIRRRDRQGAERIAIQIDHAVGQAEPFPHGAQRIGCVPVETVLSRGHSLLRLPDGSCSLQ